MHRCLASVFLSLEIYLNLKKSLKFSIHLIFLLLNIQTPKGVNLIINFFIRFIYPIDTKSF